MPNDNPFQRVSDWKEYLEIVDGPFDPWPAMDRVVEMANVDSPDRDAYESNNLK